MVTSLFPRIELGPKSQGQQVYAAPDRVEQTMHRPIDYPSDPAEERAEPLIKAPAATETQPASDHNNDVPGMAHSSSSDSHTGSQPMELASSGESSSDPRSNEEAKPPAYQEPKRDERAAPSSFLEQQGGEQASSSVLPTASSPQELAKATPQSPPLLLLPLPPSQPQPHPFASKLHPGSQPSGGNKRLRPAPAASTPTGKKSRRGGSAAATATAEPLPVDSGSPASSSSSSLLLSAGRWTADEHRAFLSGLATYGREWKRVALHIPTRTSSQVRSHAQKYFTKLQQLQQQNQQNQHQAASSSNSLGALEFQAGAGSLMDQTLAFPGSPPFTHGLDPTRTLPSGEAATGDETLPPSVQANVERILAQPETVQAEVDDTLQRLRERYRHLQHRLRQRQQRQQPQQLQARTRRGDQPDLQGGGDEQDQASLHSAMSMEVESVCNSLQDSELIALHVLQGGLEHQSAAPSASSTSSSPSNDTSTLTNTVVNSHAGVNAAAGPTENPGGEDHVGNNPTQQGSEADEKMQQVHLQESEVEEERPNPQDPPSANPCS